jgi:hypothetical protein
MPPAPENEQNVKLGAYRVRCKIYFLTWPRMTRPVEYFPGQVFDARDTSNGLAVRKLLTSESEGMAGSRRETLAFLRL